MKRLTKTIEYYLLRQAACSGDEEAFLRLVEEFKGNKRSLAPLRRVALARLAEALTRNGARNVQILPLPEDIYSYLSRRWPGLTGMETFVQFRDPSGRFGHAEELVGLVVATDGRIVFGEFKSDLGLRTLPIVFPVEGVSVFSVDPTSKLLDH